MKFLAVDPGIKGALAIYGEGVLSVQAMPTYQKKAGARGAMRRFIEPFEVLDIVRGAVLVGCETLIIEDVGGMPGQGASGAFVFGRGYGWVEMAAMASGMRVERVKAARWKPALRVPADKDAARLRASELMPEHRHLWPLKGDDGKAEAALLGYYAERFLT